MKLRPVLLLLLCSTPLAVEPFPAHHDFDPEEHALLHLRKQPADDPNDHEEPEGDANEMDDGAEAEDDNHDGEDDHNHDAEDYNASQDVWVLDPIDGTKSFITGKPLFGTLIALLEDGNPVLGVIDQCVLRERWVGANGRTVFNKKPIQAADRSCARELKEAMMYSTTPHMFGAGYEAQRFDQLRRAVKRPLYGCDCYAYGLCASGFGADLVVEADLGIYDYMALVPVVLGAGGLMTDWHGRPLTLQSHAVSRGRVVAAGNEELWKAAVKILSSCVPVWPEISWPSLATGAVLGALAAGLLLRRTASVYARLERDSSRPRYVMTKKAPNANTPHLLFDGIFKEHAVLVSDGIQAEPTADVEPCSMSFDPTGNFYRQGSKEPAWVGARIEPGHSLDSGSPGTSPPQDQLSPPMTLTSPEMLGINRHLWLNQSAADFEDSIAGQLVLESPKAASGAASPFSRAKYGLGYAEGTAADFEEGGFLNGWKKRKLYVDSWMFGSAMQDSGRSVHVKLMLA
eukprot:g30756.t1